MISRTISFFAFLLCWISGVHAQDSDGQEARTLDAVIAKYRTDRVLESSEEVESSPLFMTLGERRIAFAHFDALYPTVLLPASSTPLALPTELVDLSDIAFTANEAPHTLASLLQSPHLMGLVVIQDGKVRLEHYAPDHAKDTCLLYTSPSPRDGLLSRMPSSA